MATNGSPCGRCTTASAAAMPVVTPAAAGGRERAERVRAPGTARLPRDGGHGDQLEPVRLRLPLEPRQARTASGGAGPGADRHAAAAAQPPGAGEGLTAAA